MVTVEHMFSMFYSHEKLMSRKILYFPLINFPSLVLPRNDNITTQHCPLSALLSMKWSLMGKTKENDKLLALKVVAVAYKGSNYSDLT